MFKHAETPTHPEFEAAPQRAHPQGGLVTPPSESAPALMLASVDWLSATVHDVPGAIHHDDLLEWASTALGSAVEDWIPAEHGMYGYAEMLLGPAGAKFLRSSWLPHAHLVLPGDACRQAGPDRLLVLIDQALQWGKVTRIDVAADDHDRTMTPADVRDAIARGEAVTKAKTCQGLNSIDLHPFDDGEQLPLGGDTLYIGSFNADKLLRIYDKEIESGGEVKAIRWELQWRHDKAQQLARDVVANGVSGLGKVWASHVRRFCDFRDRDFIETEARTVTAWWSRLVQGAQRALPLPGRAARTAEQVERWLKTTIMPSLAAVVFRRGGDMTWLEENLNAARANWRPHHLALAGAPA